MHPSTLVTPQAARWPLLLALAVLIVPASARQERDVEAHLSAARAALGWDALAAGAGGLRIVGDARYLGTDVQQTIAFDGQGRFVQTFEGPLGQTSGFDGERWWSVDWSGTPRLLELGDRSQAEVAALFLSGAWTRPGGVLSFEVESSAADTLVLAFAHADGVLSGRVTLDADSHRPRSLAYGRSESPSTWSFEDYREHDGFWFPQRLVLSQSGIEQDLDTRRVEAVEHLPEAAFALPSRRAPDTHFDTELPPEIEVMRVRTGHLLVHPLVDGQDLGWFIFDSGAGTNCISTHVAEGRLEGPFGQIAARGVGGTVPAGFWRAESLQLGCVSVDAPIFMGLDLSFLAGPFGVEVAGILGYEFLSRCTVEFDQTAPAIALFDPRHYALPADGHWRAAVLYGRHPCVQAGFDDREGLFKIDTGAAGDTVTFHYPAVRDLQLTEGRSTTAGTAGGVGGQVSTRDGVLARFELGGHEFRALPASFALEEKGAFADGYVLGNIGGKLIEPFVLVFDYPAQRLGFIPRP